MQAAADGNKAKDRQPETDNLDLPHIDEKIMPDIDSMLTDGKPSSNIFFIFFYVLPAVRVVPEKCKSFSRT